MSKLWILSLFLCFGILAGEGKVPEYEWDGKLVPLILNTKEEIKVRWIVRKANGDWRLQKENGDIFTFDNAVITEVKGKILESEPKKFVWCKCPCNGEVSKMEIKS